MKSNFFLFIFFLYFFINIPKIYSSSFHKNKNSIKNVRLIEEEEKISDSLFTTTIYSTYDDVTDTIFVSDMSDIIDSNTNSTADPKVKSSSSGLSAGIIIAIVIPSVVVIIGLVFMAIACSRTNSSPTKPNLQNKNIDISTSEINKEENSGQINPEIKGNDSTVNV